MTENNRSFKTKVGEKYRQLYPYGRKTKSIENKLFLALIFIIIVIAYLQPSADASSQRFFLIKFVTLVAIFSIMAISLNVHTGMTGMVNFGVIFFVGIGAITTGLLSAKLNYHPLVAIAIGIVISAIVGFLLAYPTIRLRTDYFAIVTVSIGEILRVLMQVEPTFQSRTQGSGFSTQGISQYDKPFEDWWERQFGSSVVIGGKRIQIQEYLTYDFFLMSIAIIALVLCFIIAERILNSPYGRVLKTIREDEDVVGSYGYNVFRYKTIILAIGAGMAALAGGIWAWVIGSVFPDFMDPVTSTFLVWAAFILGGKNNNRGMIIGASIIVLSDFTFRNLGNIDRTENIPLTFSTLFDWLFVRFLNVMDFFFQIIIVDIGGTIFGEGTYTEFFRSRDQVIVNMNYLQLTLIGFLIIIMLIKFEDGIMPEIPYRPNAKLNDEISKAFSDLKEKSIQSEDAENQLLEENDDRGADK